MDTTLKSPKANEKSMILVFLPDIVPIKTIMTLFIRIKQSPISDSTILILNSLCTSISFGSEDFLKGTFLWEFSMSIFCWMVGVTIIRMKDPGFPGRIIHCCEMVDVIFIPSQCFYCVWSVLFFIVKGNETEILMLPIALITYYFILHWRVIGYTFET